MRIRERLTSAFGAPGRLHGLVGAVVLFAVYCLTLLPGVGYTGDTAKFQFVGKVLGTPHATGYPLYILLNHVFVTVFPFGALAWKANLLSAVYAVAACCVVYRCLRRLGVQPWPALAAMLALGFSPTFWSQSVVAEVYSLNALFVALVVSVLVDWHRERRPRQLWAAIIIFALSVGNHMTMVLLLPAVVAFVLATEARVVRARSTWLWLAAGVVVGVGQYGYLIWRYHDPNTVFMEVCTPGLRELWHVVTGAQFKPRMFSLPLGTVLATRVPMVALQLWRELGVLLVVAGVGLVALRPRAVAWLLLLGLGGHLMFMLNYDIPDIYVYIIPVVVIGVLLVGCGLQYLLGKMGARAGRVVGPLLLVVPLLGLVGGFEKAGQQHNTADARRIEAILDYVGRDALLVGFDYHDFCYLSYYLIGERMQWERGIYLPRGYNHDEYLAYFRSDIPITMVDQRINTPVGLAVYVKDVAVVEQFRKDGLVVVEGEFGLWRVESRR